MPPESERLSPALEALVGRYADAVRRIAGRHGLATADVDEVFQLVRIRLWRALSTNRNPGSGTEEELPASYVYQAAMSAAVDVVRRRRARPAESIEDRAIAAAAPAEVTELHDIVSEELRRLLPEREVAVRLHLEGYSRPEIATLMGWTQPKARHHIYRGLADLRARLRARGIGPEGG